MTIPPQDAAKPRRARTELGESAMQNRYYTPGIPMGWFQVEYTDQLKAGDVKPLKYFG